MQETIKETLARVEFWASEAMSYYEKGSRQHDMLSRAHALIMEVAADEERETEQKALKAAQIV